MEKTTIYALTDYKGYFESKYNSVPFNSGMDQALLKQHFSDLGFEIIFIQVSEVINYPTAFWENQFVIYTSAEDFGFIYKTFFEDIIYYLELSKAKPIPSFKYLKANNNKVFMELLRYQFNNENNIKTKVFGCFEEFEKISKNQNYPLVYKQAAGAMSTGVGLIKNHNEIDKLKKISRTKFLFKEIWELWRSIKFKNYVMESKYRNKFIVQNFIPNLDGDFKILIFSDKIYVLKRSAKEGDFKASGSGIRNFVKEIPEGILEFTYNFYKTLNIPNASIDIAYNGSEFYIIEFQCLYFGSFTLTFSEFHWILNEGKFEFIEEKSELEKVYANSISKYINTLQNP